MLLRLRVSPEGYCFQDVTDLGNYADFGIHYLFLNDLFCWPRHGVELVTITNWHRWDLEYHYRPRNEKTSKSLTGNVVSKEKYLELKKLLEDEHEELEKLKEEMNEANETKNEELQNLKREKDEVFQKVLSKKDEEIKMLKRKKNNELQKLRKEKEEELKKKIKMKEDELRFLKKKKDNEDAKAKRMEELEKKLKKENQEEAQNILKEKSDNEEKTKRVEELERMNKELKKVKDEELRKLTLEKEEELRKMVKQKDDELQVVNKKKDDEKAKRIEELEKMNRELKKVKDEELRKLALGKEEELQKIVKRKDDELQVVKRKNDDERNEKDGKLKRLEDELKNVNYKLSSSGVDVINFKKQLDECRKNSWAYSSVSALLPTNSDGERKHQARRRQVPPEKFNRQELSYNFYIENIPNLTTGNNVNVYHTLYCVDDDDITEWRPPSTISIYVSKGGTGGFDVSNWWFTKATHPEGGLTMLAYYDGSHSNAPHANGPIPLPFSKDLKSIVPAQNFFMADLKPIGVRMAFAYRW
ncbi:Laminin subunit alpha-2 [Linum perenne]